jgi:hypothetical protein
LSSDKTPTTPPNHQALTDKLDEILESQFAHHEDNDSSICEANYSVCQLCGIERYWLNRRSPCSHAAPSVWVAKPCTCIFAEQKSAAKAAILATFADELERLADELATKDHPDADVPDENLNAQEAGEVFGFDSAIEDCCQALQTAAQQWRGVI